MGVPDGGAKQVPDKNHARSRRAAVRISNPGEGRTFVGARQTIAPLVQSFGGQSLKADGQYLSFGPERFETAASDLTLCGKRQVNVSNRHENRPGNFPARSASGMGSLRRRRRQRARIERWRLQN